MYFPTLYLCASSSVLIYFQPRTELHTVQETSATTCRPVTRWRGTAGCVCVFGRVVGGVDVRGLWEEEEEERKEEGEAGEVEEEGGEVVVEERERESQDPDVEA